MKRGGSSNKISYVIILIMILAFSTGLLMMQNPSITGGTAIQIISYLPEGEKLHFEVRNIPHVKEATVGVVEDTKNSKIIFEEALPPESFEGSYLSAFKVSSNAEDNFGPLEILLKIKKSDLVSIPEKELTAYLENQPLVTTISKKEGDYLYYRFSSPGLGTVVIGRQQPKEEIAPAKIEAALPVEQQPAPVKKGFFRVILDFFKRLIGN